MMNKKAVALLSGGLDSTLAIRVLLAQGVQVYPLNFVSPFCLCNRRKGSCQSEAAKVAGSFGLEIKIFPTDEEYIRTIKNPKYGYGKNMNPCLDCRIYMHRRAKEYMDIVGASFLVTGEVLGQRPMSQRRDALSIIERESGLAGLVVRPLSAKLLPPTIPEKLGVIDRNKLLAIRGRSRRAQIELAHAEGIEDYPCSAGGCLLTDPNYAKRLKDLFSQEGLPSHRKLRILRFGRHFRISSQVKLIVGRNEEENNALERLRGPDPLFVPLDFSGPAVLVSGSGDNGIASLAASLMAIYSKKRPQTDFWVERWQGSQRDRVLVAASFSKKEIEKWRI